MQHAWTDTGTGLLNTTWAAPPGYKSLKILSALVLAALAIAVVADVAAAISDLAERDLVDRVLTGDGVTFGDLTANDDRQQMVGTIQLAALAIAGGCFLIWFVTARRNVESFGAVGLHYGAWVGDRRLVHPHRRVLHPEEDHG